LEKGSLLRISAELKNLATIRQFVEETALALRVDSKAIPDIVQAVDEAATNIVVHGYFGQPGDIEIEIRPENNSLVVALRDQARSFDPTTVPPPDLTLPLEERPFGGMGVFLIRHFMDEINYRVPAQGGNELVLVKNAVVP
jgi:serine/threonine-protein kinase RsbW